MGCCASRSEERTVKRKVTLKRSTARKRTKISQNSDLDKASEFSHRGFSRKLTQTKTPLTENLEGNVYDFYQKIKNIQKAKSGVMWQALDKRTNLQRAIKEIKKSALKSIPQDLFLDEIEKMKGLDHPNIVKFHELVISADNYYFVFELMAVENMLKRLKRKYINEEFAARYLKGLLEGLAYCHDLGILHRNISLENILFSKSDDSVVKLNDFGFSWRKDAIKSHHHELNKDEDDLKYSAPETFKGIYSDKSDIWSLGIALYVMLIGRFPFNSTKDVKNGIDWKNDMFLIYSAEMKDFLSKMLTIDHRQRISAIEALSHPWLQTNY